LRHEHQLPRLLKAAGLPRSTFYYHLKMLEEEDPQAGLKKRICSIYTRHRGCYGYRRVTAQMRRDGETINHKKVQRLMQSMGLKSLVRPKKYRSYRGALAAAVPDMLQRQFTAEQPNRRWVTDVTEFNVRGEKLYLSPILDLYNGEIIAYQTSRRPVFQMVTTMLKKAFGRLDDTDAPVLHSDQGWQYQMAAYRHELSSHQVTPSMSRKGNCLDNAAMESFFGTLKSEFFYRSRFDSVEELERGLDGYIHYYNHDRIKLKLKGLSPVQYRTQALGA
jgi:transposase InsO family protein